MRKNKFLITTLIVSAAIGMSGCGKESSTETTTSTTPEAQTTTEVQTTTEPETTTEQTTTSDYSGDYSEYSTEIVEYGVGTRRLEDGRYEGPIYCQNKYSDYKVEFIKENEKVIYLTFDEGYENGYTASILDTLKEKDVKGLLIFVHGMGAGHFSYTTEINTLTKNGYKVLAYDNTGTCMSEGKSLNGFYQAVFDLKSCLEYVKTNEDLNKYNIGLIGHSWGAYSVVQVLKYRPNVKAVVALCGPDTFENIITSSMKSFGNVLKPFIRFIIKNKFGKDGIQKSSDVLQNISENVSVLLIHGEADKICTYENSIVYNKDKFEKNENIMTVSYEGKEHNLYQTIESEKYLNEVFGKIEEYKKSFKGKELEEKLNKHYSSIDYNKITEEDDEVLETIVEFFNNTVE